MSEQAAAALLGYTQTSWDDVSGKEIQPASSKKYWAKLAKHEQLAAMALGYTRKSWDNVSGRETQPPADSKYWHELKDCGKNLWPLLPVLGTYNTTVTHKSANSHVTSSLSVFTPVCL